MPAGRPSDLTPQVIEDVRRLLPVVLYLETVGDYLGLDRTTWGKWLRRGAKESRRLAREPKARPKKSEALCLEFFLAHKKALAEGEIYDLGVIKKAAAKQWQAAAWRAERRFQGHWAQQRDLMKQLTDQVKELTKLVAERGHPPAAGAAARPRGPVKPG